MNILEMILGFYATFVTCLLIMMFVATRNMLRVIRFWKNHSAHFQKAFAEMAIIAAQYREAYLKDIVEKEKV